MSYTIGFVPVSSNYYPKYSSADEYGGGCSMSYLLIIKNDGKRFVDTGEYVEILSPRNNWLQNDRIRSEGHKWCTVLDPDTKLDPAVHVYGKAIVLLEALNSYERAA